MKINEITCPDIEWPATPIEKAIPINMVQAYRCPGCRRVYISKLSAIRHADKCVKNPHNRTCFTCLNRITLTGENVEPQDKCHCTDDRGENLIDKVKWWDNGQGECADSQYTGHDIVWDCPHHEHGRGWTIYGSDYNRALDIIKKAKETT